MLTGDKEETAINIAVACKLVKPVEYMDHVIINKQICPTKEEIKAIITAEKGDLPKALIIDGPSLLTITGTTMIIIIAIIIIYPSSSY